MFIDLRVLTLKLLMICPPCQKLLPRTVEGKREENGVEEEQMYVQTWKY